MPDNSPEQEDLKYWEKPSTAEYCDDLSECSDTFKRPKLKPVTLKFDPLCLKNQYTLEKAKAVFQRLYKIYPC